VAVVRKKDRTLLPDLIAQLENADPADAVLIEDSLRTLTGEHLEGAEEWKAWQEKNGS
jgi:hypothetical protein